MAALSYLLVLALISRQASAYTWPNPQMEVLDALRYEQIGIAGKGTAVDVFPCTNFVQGHNAGRINAADWLRTVSTQHSAFTSVQSC
jgi:hypothetical protein